MIPDYKYHKLLLYLIFFVVNTQSNAQKTTTEMHSVQWVGQFPMVNKTTKTKKLGWVSKFLFGKKNDFEIIKPIAILASSPKEFYILDQGSGTIFNIKDNHKKIPKVLKKNKTNFPSLVSFSSIPNYEILFTDSRLNKIYQLNEKEKKLVVLNKTLQLQQPTGIAYSKITNEIWVVETAAHKISILNKNGELIKTLGKRGIGPGEFNFPTDIWIDNFGKAYVVDTMNFRIQIFNKNGEIISIFGEQGNATGYFARPKGIATDSFGNIYVTDVLYHTVQVFDISGNFLYKFGEQGRGKEQFWMPSGIYIDANNFIYVSDSYNSRIQIFKLVDKL